MEDISAVHNYDHFGIEPVGIPLKFALCLAATLLYLGSIIFISIQFQTSNSVDTVRYFRPIFAALHEPSGYVSVINMDDLSKENIELHQPDKMRVRHVSRDDLTLDLAVVEDALKNGMDWIRVGGGHDIKFLSLPNGEKAVWIKVYHIGMGPDYWNGLIYVIRDGVPEVIARVVGAHSVFFEDMNGNGNLDVVFFVDKLSRYLPGQRNPPPWYCLVWNDEEERFRVTPVSSFSTLFFLILMEESHYLAFLIIFGIATLIQRQLWKRARTKQIWGNKTMQPKDARSSFKGGGHMYGIFLAVFFVICLPYGLFMPIIEYWTIPLMPWHMSNPFPVVCITMMLLIMRSYAKAS